ncbi:MAG: hypothetical protein K0S75_2005 [Clostridia bacterium]|jgi:hypothetical protein|nr:hypothetical protein [Clostridia bacterium]
MRKFFVISLPIGALIFFVLIMISGNYLKMPMGKNDNIPEIIEVLIHNLDEEKWEEANRNTEVLSKAWSNIIERVQFSSERDEINAFSMNVARLRGGIAAKDKANSLSELYEAYEHWKELGN